MKKKITFFRPLLFLLVANVLLIGLVFVIKGRMPPVIPIYYGLPSGTDQLGPAVALAYLPLTSLIITLVSAVFIYLLKDAFLQKILIVVSILATILSSFAYYKVVLLVGNILR